MSQSFGDVQGRPMTLPPLAGEDYVCESCGIDYAATSLGDAMRVIAGVPDALRTLVTAVPATRRHTRPDDDTWSVIEYACHLRDVFISSTIRLHRAMHEQRPRVEPLFNDFRARLFDYASSDLD